MNVGETSSKIIRDPAFGIRLVKACDTSSRCPDQQHGRLTWLKRELDRVGSPTSVESVRRWYGGEMKPRADKIEALAQVLEVDVAWLSLGIDPGMEPREKRARNASADGAVNLIAGFIQMDGGHPAFPEENDKRATSDRVDLYAIIKGANYAFHISTGTKDGRDYKFKVPADSDAIILGVIRDGFSIQVFEITPEMIETHGNRRGASAEVAVQDVEAALRRITDFATRL